MTSSDRYGPTRMKDVASAAGVSMTTVSLVLNDKAVGIPAETKQRVLDAAAALGYRPNALAANLRTRTSDTIGFVSDTIATTPYAGAMIQGAQDAAWKAGKLILTINTNGDPAVEAYALNALLGRQVEGMVYAAMYHQVIDVPAVAKEVPLVLLDARSADSEIPSVVPDERGGAYEATSHLISHGHKRIGFLKNTASVPAANERLEGYREALEANAIAFDGELVVAGDSGLAGGYAAAMALLVEPHRPTGLFCFNDAMAAGAARAAHELNLRIPDDLSLVGFDNLELVAPFTNPPLTTMQLPHYEMGVWAVEQLINRIDGEDFSVFHQRMQCPLVERASVGPPPTRT